MTGMRTWARIGVAALLAASAAIASGCWAMPGGDGAQEGTPMPAPGAVGGTWERTSPPHGSSADVTGEAELHAESKSSESPPLTAGSPDEDARRLVVKSKSVVLRVKDVEKAVRSIRDLARRHDAFVESLQLAEEPGIPVYREGSSDGRPLAGYVTVRVPVDAFERFTSDAAGLGKVLRQSENASDVTQQHVDLKARLENLRAEEKRLRELFDRAERVEDMLAIERELARVRGEAEAMQAQIEQLERQAAYSTVTLELVGPEPIVEPAGTDWGVADAFREGVRAFVGSFNAIVVLAMGSALPLSLLAIAVLVIRRVLVRRRRVRAETDETASG